MEKRTGQCHCGAVKYEVNLELTHPVIECNCSHCGIKSLLLSPAPQSELSILSGEDNLTEYRFNTEKISHLFCKTCGVQPFAKADGADGTPMSMVNVRTVDNIDLSVLTRMPYDGKSV